MGERFENFCDGFHRHFSRDANDRVVKGIGERLGELPDPSPAEAAARVKEASDLLAAADTITAGSFDESLDLDLARLSLKAEIHRDTYTFNGRTTAAQMPRAGDDIGDGIFLLLINDPRPDGDRLADITARIEAIPEHLEAMFARLDTPVARWVAMDIDKIGGLPELFDTIGEWANATAWPDAGRLASAQARAREAMTTYVRRLEGLASTTELFVGPDTAQRIVELRGIDRPLDALHRMAADFLRDTGAIIEELRGRLAKKYGLAADASVAEVHQHLNRRFRIDLPDGHLDDILERYEVERARILAYIRERDLFPIPEDQDIRILRTPAFMAPSIPAGAMMPPPAFRPGIRQSLVYLTLSEELIDEHTEISIPSMMIHEGIPGHHLQLSTASMHPSVIRRHVHANEHAEGWTTMLEDYMLDLGYMGELSDEARFSTKRDLSRIGARVAIDLFFMTGDRSYLEVGVDCDLSPADPFVAAGNLLQKVTGFVPGRVEAELNWYSQERGYPLSYLTGNRMVWELKAEVAKKQAGRLEGLDLDRAFHRLYLESGNMPLRFLRRVFAEANLI
ncbi:MAG TPA: DUF885 family protein [Kofleriaceae bacterium]|nr:DUF885 family protein [Kofleriaceae bacterium]